MKVFFLILFLFSFISVKAEYKQLPKHSSVKVFPDTRVYLNIDGFKDDEAIDLKFTMDFIITYINLKGSYTFQIQQVSALNPENDTLWNNLPSVTSRNVKDKFYLEYTYSWTEKKKHGNNYLLIIPLAPFSGFNKDLKGKIEIENPGGLSTGAIIGIVLGVTIAVIIIISLIVFFICFRRHSKVAFIMQPQSQPLCAPPQQLTYQSSEIQQTLAYQQPQAFQSSNFQQSPLYMQPPNYQQQPTYQPPTGY